MARVSIWHDRFNRDDEFVALRAMLVNGRQLAPGDRIDKSLFSTRRLRCLYEWRQIRKADAVTQETAKPAVMLEEQDERRDKINERARQLIAEREAATTPAKRGRPRKQV